MVWWLYLKYPFLPLQKDLAQSWPLEPSGKRGTPLLTNNIWKIKVTEKSQSLKTICNTWYENLVEESLSEKKVSGLPRPIYDLILHYDTFNHIDAFKQYKSCSKSILDLHNFKSAWNRRYFSTSNKIDYHFTDD